MNCETIIVNIVIPLLCSILGGLCTVVGVYLTIVYQRKKDEQELLQRNKPMFFCYKYNQDYQFDRIYEFIFGNSKSHKYKIDGIFKNTEKIIFKIDRIMVNTNSYYSTNGVIVDKDKTFEIIAYIDEVISIDSECYLFAKDINDYEYKYRIIFEKDFDEKRAIIESIEEEK